ncbi:GTPase IMAP family member 7-like [Chanos chanos]|uniref:GTPase IMAP family member 7-like n=1 Tax=Chanos chanos TaxID=29144 RepID=A0A6J2V2X4_CHACN|nr:GTPase IMAP family member 7-like [Chanos chanos]
MQVGGESPSSNLPVSPELRLVLLGLSETVKWAAGNTILGREEFGIQAAASTETQHSESRQGEVAGRQLVVVDTPDWLSPGLSQEEMRKDVGLCVRLSAPGPHTFLLVCPLEPSEGEESELLERMEDIFGDKCWGHTMILFINTEGLRGVNVEEVIQMKSHRFQQLMEKCGNRCHLVNVKNRDVTEVTELLQKIEEMVSKNQEKFYSSDVYQEAVEQVTEMKILIEKEKKNRREKEEKELERKYEIDLHNYVMKTEQQNKEKDEKIRELEKRIAELEKELENEKNENRKKELERQVEEEKERRRETEREREKREKEDRHKEELEEIREKYEMEAKAEAERNLMKIILPELQSKIRPFIKKLQSEFNIKTEEKDEEMKRMMKILEEKERRIERIKYILEEKDREIERNKETLEAQAKEIKRLRKSNEEQDRSLILIRKPYDAGSSLSSWNKNEYIRVFKGDDVTLSCYLSPETSAVTMEISWFKGTECIYQYKNGEVWYCIALVLYISCVV